MPYRAGLSPRVRGNRCRGSRARHPRGPIPACAGEPRGMPDATGHRPAYPRVCGGTASRNVSKAADHGLSPRVRGNRLMRWNTDDATRPIPACAGEPSNGGGMGRPWGAYPRVCGGTQARRSFCGPVRGLSPRVRGNLAVEVSLGVRYGPIPACAGEPPPGHFRQTEPEAYPRVCGGTPVCCAGFVPMAGLSPRVRGNPQPVQTPDCCPRPIPACAGEPSPAAGLPRAARAYPRVCGGTGGRGQPARPGTGLSPRVRGNP